MINCATGLTITTAAFPASAAVGIRLDEADMTAFEPDAKIALLATLDPDDLPHITLITSLQARGASELMFGQFTEGSSKENVRRNPRTGFLVMSARRELWRGKARWRGEARAGNDYELYNRKPMFRYNAYFGIHTVHYLDIVELAGKRRISVPHLLAGALVNEVGHLRAKLSGTDPRAGRVLTPWSEKHLSKLKTLKFLCTVADDGYPEISMPVACRAVDSRTLVFSTAGQHGELDDLAEGCSVALFGLNLEMESVLVRGRFTGYRGHGGVRTGGIDIDWVYNSMPPKQGRIYPPEPLSAITESDLPRLR